MKRIKISHGLTFKGSISSIGSVIFVVGSIVTIYELTHETALWKLFVMIPVTIFGAILFISIRGALIDSDKKRIKPYLDLLVYKVGTWQQINEYEAIMLKYTQVSQRMNSRGNTTDFLTQSYDIVLTSHNKEDLLLKAFPHYDKAKSLLDEFSKLLNLPSVDTFLLIKEKMQEPKLRRR